MKEAQKKEEIGFNEVREMILDRDKVQAEYDKWWNGLSETQRQSMAKEDKEIFQQLLENYFQEKGKRGKKVPNLLFNILL
ncbi:MAG: hypothetical protein NZ822_01040 [Patescibacteria group bacterium]|nr:hypothetical protein [Patescibacteria group bacterium]